MDTFRESVSLSGNARIMEELQLKTNYSWANDTIVKRASFSINRDLSGSHFSLLSVQTLCLSST
jgi:hypothetical protein